MSRNIDKAWAAIFQELHITKDSLVAQPVEISADTIKEICRNNGLHVTEPRILCKQDTRNSRPHVFKEYGCFILPKKNGEYYILQGEGYVDIPAITSEVTDYDSAFEFDLKSSSVGDSEMQYLDFAYANSLIRHFMEDPTLVLTIRGRKYTPAFSFRVGDNTLAVESVQTEVDAGYEGRDQVVLIEAKNSAVGDTIIRQLYYPYRQWKINTGKDVSLLFFERQKTADGSVLFHIWKYVFEDDQDYNSIKLARSGRYRIVNHF